MDWDKLKENSVYRLDRQRTTIGKPPKRKPTYAEIRFGNYLKIALGETEYKHIKRNKLFTHKSKYFMVSFYHKPLRLAFNINNNKTPAFLARKQIKLIQIPQELTYKKNQQECIDFINQSINTRKQQLINREETKQQIYQTSNYQQKKQTLERIKELTS